MSRLIEALRKAEEQKRKEQSKKESGESSDQAAAGLESGLASDPFVAEESPPTEKTSAAAPETADEHSIEFELEPTEPPTYSRSDDAENIDPPQPDTPEELGIESPEQNDQIHSLSAHQPSSTLSMEADGEPDQMASSPILPPAPVHQEPIDTQVDEPPLPSSLPAQDFNRRQTDTLHLDVVIEPEEQKEGKRRGLVWLASSALILLIAFGLSFFFFYEGNNHSYPSYPQSAQRGFLESTSVAETSAQSSSLVPETSLPNQDSLANVTKDTESKESLLEAAQSLVVEAVRTVNENTASTLEQTIQTFNADNALTSQANSGQSQPKKPVLQIKRSEPIQGSASSLNYAEDNALGGETVAARLEYEELLRNQPTNRDALIGLASLEAATGNNEQAKNLYATLLQLNPKDPSALLGLIENSQLSSTAYESKLKTLESSYPSYGFIPFKLGNFYASQRRWNEARGAYRRALNVTSNKESVAVNPDYAFNLAIALEQTQKPQLALQRYKEARALAHASVPSFDVGVLNHRIQSLEKEL